jgi:tryptophanase
MLLNPASEFFKKRIQRPDSYMSRIKHKNVKEIEEAAAHYFHVKTEYFLGIEGTNVFPNQNVSTASLYVIKGIRKRR